MTRLTAAAYSVQLGAGVAAQLATATANMFASNMFVRT